MRRNEDGLFVNEDFMGRVTGGRIPEKSISVCIENKEVFTYQLGYSDLEKEIPMTSDKRLYNLQI